MNDTELRDLDAPPVNGLDSIFVLPPEIADDPLVQGWYHEMARQLRQEAAGLPMKAAQYTLMERICFFYAYMRYHEFHTPGMSGREKLQNIAAWSSMLDQFNRLLEKHNDKVVNELLVQIQDIIESELTIISDETERARLLLNLSEAFARVEL